MVARGATKVSLGHKPSLCAVPVEMMAARQAHYIRAPVYCILTNWAWFHHANIMSDFCRFEEFIHYIISLDFMHACTHDVIKYPKQIPGAHLREPLAKIRTRLKYIYIYSTYMSSKIGLPHSCQTQTHTHTHMIASPWMAAGSLWIAALKKLLCRGVSCTSISIWSNAFPS